MSIAFIIKQFRWSLLFVLALVVAEGIGFLLFPLFIGYAVNDMVNGSHNGLINLAILGVMELVVSSGRRFFDTRVYAKVFKEIGAKIINENHKQTDSVISARVNMFEELIYFMEKSMPEILVSLVSVIGTVIIIYSFSISIFTGCLLSLMLTAVVFGTTSKRTIRYNKNYNDTMEEQVKTIESRNPIKVDKYFKNLMRWAIKLSDMETINFSIIWLGMVGLLVFSIYNVTTASEVVQYGTMLTIVMYVFSFIQHTEYMPYYYQQWLRLNEIAGRLATNE